MSEAVLRFINGRSVDILHMKREDVSIEVIAHAGAQLNRFGGHTPWPYSVALHQVFASRLVELAYAESEKAQYNVLMHDATEALGCVDLPSPLKALCPDYRRIEHRVWEQIAPWFGLELVQPPYVKLADQLALRLEQTFLKGYPMPEGVSPAVTKLADYYLGREFHWQEAEAQFLSRYVKLAPVLN
jgi:hypothetical protein